DQLGVDPLLQFTRSVDRNLRTFFSGAQVSKTFSRTKRSVLVEDTGIAAHLSDLKADRVLEVRFSKSPLQPLASNTEGFRNLRDSSVNKFLLFRGSDTTRNHASIRSSLSSSRPI